MSRTAGDGPADSTRHASSGSDYDLSRRRDLEEACLALPLVIER